MNTVSRSADLLAGRPLVVRRLIPAESAVEEEMRRRRNELRAGAAFGPPPAPRPAAVLGERARGRRAVRALRLRARDDARAVREGLRAHLRRAARPGVARGPGPPPPVEARARPRGRQARELLRRGTEGGRRHAAPRESHRLRHRLDRRRAALPVPPLEHARRHAAVHAPGELRPGDAGGPRGMPADGPDQGRLRPRHHPGPHRQRPLPGRLLHEHDVARAEEGTPGGDPGDPPGRSARGPAEPDLLHVPDRMVGASPPLRRRPYARRAPARDDVPGAGPARRGAALRSPRRGASPRARGVRRALSARQPRLRGPHARRRPGEAPGRAPRPVRPPARRGPVRSSGPRGRRRRSTRNAARCCAT